MSKKKRIILVVAAGGGWVTAALIAVAALMFDAVTSVFFGRLFALAGLEATVLTLGIWLERSARKTVRYNIPVPVDIAHGIGFQQGWDAARIMNPAQLPPLGLGNSWAKDLGKTVKADTGPSL